MATASTSAVQKLAHEEGTEVRRSMDSVSHGRGGAGNIRQDDTPYVDGEIVREGVMGDQGAGKYSSGRGGAGNIDGSPQIGATHRNDHTTIPEVALREQPEQNHHVGRGGAGNEQYAKPADKKEVGLADKLKNKLLGK